MKKEFFEYIGAPDSLKGYARSYKLVFFKCFFDLMNKDGAAGVDNMVREFKKFYINRVNAGKIPDANVDARIENINESTDSEIYQVIIQNPYKHIREHGFMFKGKSSSGDIMFRLSGALLKELSREDIDEIIKIVDTKTRLYFDNIDSGMRTNNTMNVPDKEESTECNNKSEDTMWSLYDEIQGYINKVENVIASAEKISRKKNADALDIDDDELCQRMQAEAFREIKALRNIKGFLKSISQEAEKLTNVSADAEFIEEDIIQTPVAQAEQINLIPDEYKQIDFEESSIDNESTVESENVILTETITSQNFDTVHDSEFEADKDAEKYKEISFELLGDVYVGIQARWLLYEAMQIIMQKEPYAVSRLPFNEKYQRDGKRYFAYRLADLHKNGKKLFNNMWVSEVDNADEAIYICNSFLISLGYNERMKLSD